uniref:Uncharacterized protein n=1 Tax=Ananas comosus var. bracteatus TaxID=296719 RepID=A0A6V7Q6L9_ANACO|nr:unnamed protein product [Ananas comosus var. bracteatus]
MRPVADSQGSSSPFGSIGRSILSLRRDQIPPPPTPTIPPPGGGGGVGEVEGFQRHVAELLLDLAGDDVLSLSWARKLLDVFLICLEEFRVLLFNSGAQATPPPPPLDRLLADFFDRAVKALDVCNAVRDGVDQIRQWKKLLDIGSPPSPPPGGPAPPQQQQRQQRQRQRRPLPLPLVERLALVVRGAAAAGHRRRPRGAARGRRRRHRRPRRRGVRDERRALLHHVGAGGRDPVPGPRPADALLGAAARVPVGGAAACAAGAIVEESKRKDRKHSAGLLKEIYQIERCSRQLVEITDAVHFPMDAEREAEVREAVGEIAHVCEALKEELDPLERQVREVFHRIVRSRTEGLDCLSRPHNPE